jgi:AmmeMemoRadiSam system protein B/AmmeMemoRadiSam system protein A
MTASHTTPFAGSWYPARRPELETLLDELFAASLKRTGPCLLPRPLAFVVPHAGLVYSGTVAAAAYRHLQAAQPERVFLLGFSHRGGAPGAAIPDIGAFQTPLGEVKIDQAAARQLASSGQCVLTPEGRVCDHSVEIQLPLLQRAVPRALVIPLYVGTLDAAQRSAVARALAQQTRPGDVLLASSDLTHYGRAFGYEPFPADSDVERRLSKLDAQAIEAAGSLDPALFLDTLHELDSTVCGYAPVALLLETLGILGDADLFQQTLDYQTSGELTGDFRQSVSYGALGYFRADSFFVDAETQVALLASARATLTHLSATGERKLILPDAACPALLRRAPVFVSLHEKGELFGCIGMRSTDRPLAESVSDLTLSAALDDPRFEQRARVPSGIDIEISVLTPMKRIRDWKSFQVGRDGACMEYGGLTQLLLPQVANHGAFTATGFLEALCHKGGLPRAAYREVKARLSIFRAQVFDSPAEPGAATPAAN